MFILDREKLNDTGRVVLGEWIDEDLSALSSSIASLSEATGCAPVQCGRVIALRQTDNSSQFSAFKAALYHAKYEDMQNTARFLERIAAKHQTYEVLRGETILFLFVGVSKNTYDAMATLTQGRYGRMAGGLHHSLPWGIEIPYGIDNPETFADSTMQRVRDVVRLEKQYRADGNEATRAALREARFNLPLCYLVSPFALEFSEEALVQHVFKQRLWEQGASAREETCVVDNMWQCCMKLDEAKYSALYDLCGPHTTKWEDTMRTLRDSGLTLGELLEKFDGNTSVYEALCAFIDDAEDTYGNNNGGKTSEIVNIQDQRNR